ncbi:hypothetical protein [Paraburkholderia sp. SOS3]|uniref:hypothetical protein n=1 Tax=Paraburkholderia sp. SOS3 TaxID=1926494 RepID=UPI0012EBCD18|nr:hypothetical protein [Paraburkholderia sp. SOS3]
MRMIVASACIGVRWRSNIVARGTIGRRSPTRFLQSLITGAPTKDASNAEIDHGLSSRLNRGVHRSMCMPACLPDAAQRARRLDEGTARKDERRIDCSCRRGTLKQHVPEGG